MWRCELLVFCALLLSGAARTASAQADPTDCGATRSLLLAKGVPESVLSETTATGAAAGELCAANSSCCSLPWEHGIRHVVQDEFRKMLLENTEHLKRLLQEQAIAVQDAILTVVALAKETTQATYSEHNPGSAGLAHQTIRQLFDNFTSYFQSQISDPQLEDAITLFFDDLFVVAYQEARQPNEPALNETFAACLRLRRDELRPFKQAPLRMKEKVLRTFGVAKFYLQSLYVGLEVLSTTTDFGYSDSCYDALTRLSYCSACQGLAEVKPCTGFCINVMRGCMAPLSKLSAPWADYVGVLQRLATSLQQSNDVKGYLFKMYMNISEAMMLAWNNMEHLEYAAAAACGSPPAPETPQRRRRQVPLQHRPSGDLELALPQRPVKVQLTTADPEPELTSVLRQFNSGVEQYRRLFHHLPDKPCNEWAFHDQAECWNGRNLGDYKKPLAGVGLDSQVFNPEVNVPHMAEPVLEEQSDRLGQIQQISLDKMVALPATGSLHGGLEDDGGWHEGSGSGDWSVYDDEDGIYEYPDYGSGSGDGGIHDAYQDTFDGDTLLPPERPHDGDVHIGTDEEQEEVVPRTNVPPATTAVPPKEKAAGAAAVSASCWPLLLAMLAAARW